jgi:hypothetical protein
MNEIKQVVEAATTGGKPSRQQRKIRHCQCLSELLNCLVEASKYHAEHQFPLLVKVHDHNIWATHMLHLLLLSLLAGEQAAASV